MDCLPRAKLPATLHDRSFAVLETFMLTAGRTDRAFQIEVTHMIKSVCSLAALLVLSAGAGIATAGDVSIPFASGQHQLGLDTQEMLKDRQ